MLLGFTMFCTRGSTAPEIGMIHPNEGIVEGPSTVSFHEVRLYFRTLGARDSG